MAIILSVLTINQNNKNVLHPCYSIYSINSGSSIEIRVIWNMYLNKYNQFAELTVVQRRVHTMNDKDNDISVQTSGRYHLFTLSARASAALNSRAHDSRAHSDWLSIFL